MRLHEVWVLQSEASLIDIKVFLDTCKASSAEPAQLFSGSYLQGLMPANWLRTGCVGLMLNFQVENLASENCWTAYGNCAWCQCDLTSFQPSFNSTEHWQHSAASGGLTLQEGSAALLDLKSLLCLLYWLRALARSNAYVRAIHSSKNCESKKRSSRSVLPASGGLTVAVAGGASALLPSPDLLTRVPPLNSCIIAKLAAYLTSHGSPIFRTGVSRCTQSTYSKRR